MRILAVDPGSKHIGLAISDLTGSIANPLAVINHISRPVDAAAVADIALTNGVSLIVVGQSLDDDGNPTFEGRRAGRFGQVLMSQTTLPVVFWDESLTTQDARSARIAMGVSRKNRSGHLDSLAAAVLLQSYLDAKPQTMKRRSACLPWILILGSLAALTLLALAVFVPQAARQSFGEPSPALDTWQRLSYGFELVWNAGDITQARDPAGVEQLFSIQSGESVLSISNRLEQAGLIRSAGTFRTYLLWTGLDTVIQTGIYRLSPALTGYSIAQMLKSTTLTEVTLTVLPGWRMEEIAATLPTSGLEFSPQEFISAAGDPVFLNDLVPAGVSAEGFLFPGSYILARTTTADQLISILINGFSSHLSAETLAAYSDHGLTLYQAVTMASIIQREAVVDGEMPLIASVFYNRLAAGMNLQTDPTVQYALGYNNSQGTWWTNPLSLDNLKFDSPYNTYIHPGLPPGPISNPGLAALEAVAAPVESNYYYFQARCDGSGLHNFAETFEQHQQNNCP